MDTNKYMPTKNTWSFLHDCFYCSLSLSLFSSFLVSFFLHLEYFDYFLRLSIGLIGLICGAIVVVAVIIGLMNSINKSLLCVVLMPNAGNSNRKKIVLRQCDSSCNYYWLTRNFWEWIIQEVCVCVCRFIVTLDILHKLYLLALVNSSVLYILFCLFFFFFLRPHSSRSEYGTWYYPIIFAYLGRFLRWAMNL